MLLASLIATIVALTSRLSRRNVARAGSVHSLARRGVPVRLIARRLSLPQDVVRMTLADAPRPEAPKPAPVRPAKVVTNRQKLPQPVRPSRPALPSVGLANAYVAAAMSLRPKGLQAG